MTDVDLSALQFDADGELLEPMQLLDIEPLTAETFAKERDVNAGPGPGHQLKNYWTKGKGAIEIGWKTPGDFTRCVAKLGKHVKNPQGLCAEYHHAATGMWPGDKRNPGMKKHDGELVAAVDDKGNIVEAATPTENVTDDDLQWFGDLTLEGEESGDGRMFNERSLDWAELPLPLMYTPTNMGEHKGSVQVGLIDHIERRANGGKMSVFGRGHFDDLTANKNAAEAHGMMQRGMLRGNSVDVDSVKNANVELVFDTNEDGEQSLEPSLQIFHKGRIRGTTLVPFPAFANATLQLGVEPTEEAVAVTASAAVDDPWNAGEMFNALVASSGGRIERSLAAQAFAYVPAGDGPVKGHECKYLHHSMTDEGELGDANLTACAAGIHVLNTKPGTLTSAERRVAYRHLSAHIEAAGLVAPDLEDVLDSVTASTALITAEDCPPSEWFQDPKLSDVTPITITADGRIYGHGALWDSCHTGFADVCRTAPREGSHDYYRLGEVLCADGSRIACGTITLGTGHAPTMGMSARAAMEHYDNTGTAAADVVSGEDEFGIWVAGSIRPGLTAAGVRELMGAKLSGDWRKFGGKLRLVAMLAVNVPGFGVPRLTTGVQGGHQMSLVAAGIVPDAEQLAWQRERDAIAVMKERLAKDVGLDIQSKKAALVASLSA
jgi:hypothetical protein